MKTVTTGIVFLLTLALVGTASDGKDQKEPQLRLELDLVDGSRVIGTPGIESVPIQTSYAKMDVPLKQIRSLTMAEDHETASCILENGDKLKGVINLKPIQLETVFGKVKIGIEHIREFRVVTSGLALPDALRKGLVLCYSFDRNEGDRVTDLGGKNNNGAVRDGAKWIGEGQRGGGYRMPGGCSRIEVNPSPDFSLTPDVDKTLCLWWKKEGDIQHKVLVSQKNQPNYDSGFTLRTLSSERRYYLDFQQNHYAQFSAAFSDDAWNFVVVVKTGISYKVYQNGHEAPLVASMGWPMTLDPTMKTSLEIGGTHRATDGFEGVVDEVMIFDRALSDAEVKQIYDALKCEE